MAHRKRAGQFLTQATRTGLQTSRCIGLGFLPPLDLLFSCVFFYLFWNGQVAAANQMAWDNVQGSPFVTEQGFGAVLGLFIAYAWSGRKHYDLASGPAGRTSIGDK